MPFRRLRRNKKSAARFAHRHDRKPDYLHASLRAHVRGAYGMKKYTIYLGDSAAGRDRFGESRGAGALSAGALAGMTSVAAGFQLGQPAFSWQWRATDCFRHTLRASFAFSHALHHNHRTGIAVAEWRC